MLLSIISKYNKVKVFRTPQSINRIYNDIQDRLREDKLMVKEVRISLHIY